MNNFFETEIKDKLHWTLSQWQSSGDNFRAIKRLVNSLKYWCNKLRSALRNNNVIFTLYDENDRILYPSLQKVADKLSSFNNDINIIGYAKFKNRRFLSITLESLEKRDFVIENLLEIDNAKVAYLHWVEETLQDEIIIDWLSNETDLDLTLEFCMQYLEVRSVVRVTTVLDNGSSCTSGKVIFKGRFKNGVNIDEIPHFAIIDNLECHILIQGRPYQCFTCRNIGHKASRCLKVYCKHCKAIVFKTHSCERFKGIMLGSNPELSEVPQQEILNEINKNLFYKMGTLTKPSLNILEKGGEANNDVLCNKSEMNAQVISEMHVKNENYGNMDSIGSSSKFLLAECNKNTGFANSFGSQNHNDAVVSKFITDEAVIGDPNFILLDTSSDESDSDSDNCNSFMNSADLWNTNLNKCAGASRVLIKQSSKLLTRKLYQKSFRPEAVKETQVVQDYFAMENNAIEGQESMEVSIPLLVGEEMGEKQTRKRRRRGKKK